LQGDSNKFDQDGSTSSRRPGDSSDSRAQEIYRKMQLAELSAAEEKHRKLLKRLKHGGHDTTNLETELLS
jgi:hypothetical protein